MTKKKNYKSAILELREILSKIQSDEISIDELSNHIKRAEELITFCKEKLRGIEKEIKEMKKD